MKYVVLSSHGKEMIFEADRFDATSGSLRLMVKARDKTETVASFPPGAWSGVWEKGE